MPGLDGDALPGPLCLDGRDQRPVPEPVPAPVLGSSGLTAAEEARIIGANKPRSAGFLPTLLVSSVALLNDEAGDFGYSLIGLVRDAQIDDANKSDL